MSRFDQETFSQLLKKAIGDRQQKQFADLIGISDAHLSRIVRRKFKNPPSIDTLKNIAANAQNGITYHELMAACGYVGEDDPIHDFILPVQDTPSSKYIKATILTALESLDFSWTLENNPDDLNCDLSISATSDISGRWSFLFLVQSAEELMNKQLYGNYLKLLFQKLTPTDKVSFVTCSKKEFDLYLEQRPQNLNVNLSIILIDESKLEIQEEQWISKSVPVNLAMEQFTLNK